MDETLEIIEVTPENVDELPCCGIMDPEHEGRRRKIDWLKSHFELGLRARILSYDGKHQCGYIESIPGTYAWRGVDADGYLFIHCLWVFYKRFQNRGLGQRLIQCVLDDAEAQKMKGVSVVARDRPWLSDSKIFLKKGFEVVDTLPPDYELLVRKFDPEAADPSFLEKRTEVFQEYREGLTVIRAGQCPHTIRFSEKIHNSACREHRLESRIVDLATHEDARNAPTTYAVFSVICEGDLLADHQISQARFRNLMKRRSG